MRRNVPSNASTEKNQREKKEQRRTFYRKRERGKLKIEEKRQRFTFYGLIKQGKGKGKGRREGGGEGGRGRRVGKVETSRLIPKQSLPFSAKNNLCFSINVFQLPARCPDYLARIGRKVLPPAPPD